MNKKRKMVTAINILTSISVLLFLGLVISLVAYWLKIPDILLLILTGIALSSVVYNGELIFSFPLLFLSTTSLLALAMIVFDGAAKLKIRQLDTFSLRTFKFVFIFLIVNLVLFSAVTYFILGTSVALSILFATMVMGTSPEIVLSLLKTSQQKVVSILKIESVINTPLTVLLPFIVIDVAKNIDVTLINGVIDQLGPFLTKFVAGLGAGLLVALILYQLMKKGYSTYYSPLAVAIAALLSFVLAENLGGNGVLAVTTLGLIFGNIYLKQKVSILEFESVFTKALYVLVFILVGLVIKLPLTTIFFVKSVGLFISYLIIRYVIIELSFRHEKLSFKEKIFMTLNSSKGLATVAVVLLLGFSLEPTGQHYLQGLAHVLDVTLAFVLYSILTATLVTRFAKFFIKEDIKQEKLLEKPKQRKRK
jgi:NhaP-type Na+/H+ or K+/H+ antiporter